MQASPSKNINTPYTVRQITKQIKQSLEGSFSEVWIRGEVSNLRKQTSGHVYFTLKDSQAQIPCALFLQQAIRVTTKLTEGMELLVYGDISVYEPRGAYQLIVQAVQPIGQGDLAAKFEALKTKLASEGLFAADRKPHLPKLPLTIGVITSPTGAALQDFLSILQRNQWRGNIILIPSLVQGKEAPDSLIQALHKAKTLSLDTLIICRGGGSQEDLFCFNDEAFIRAIATLEIPTISAVGHEIDFTLTDFVCSLRAETPSAAAEMILRTQQQLLHYIDVIKKQLQIHVPANLLRQLEQRLDELHHRLNSNVSQSITASKHKLNELTLHLNNNFPQTHLDALKTQLAHLSTRLHQQNHQQRLKQGYAFLSTSKQQPITSINSLASGSQVNITLHDGSTSATIKKP